MGNKLNYPCIPRIENRVSDYFEEPINIPVSIEGQLTHLDADKILCNSDECCICMDNLSCITLDCGHNNFCWECIRELAISGDKKCPICRDNYSAIEINYKLSFKVNT